MSFDARSDEEIRALAEAVADELEHRGFLSPPGPAAGRVLKVADVATLLGRSRPWVYEHAAELGAFRFGHGPKARLGFDRDAIERWKRDRQILKPPDRQVPRRARRRKRSSSPAVRLIPYDPSPYGA